LLGILAVGERGDHATRFLLEAYDHEQPSTRSSCSAIAPLAPWDDVRLDVVRIRDGGDDGFEVVCQLGMVSGDLAVQMRAGTTISRPL
jgi:hypothetical protein